MRGFMAGATSTGLSVASSTVVARSLAWPPAILASRSAVAGATIRRSASRDRRMWPISCSSLRSNRSVNTRSVGQRADGQRRHELGAARVITARTEAPCLAQAADEVEALVGGDAAADDEQNALLFHVGRSKSWDCRQASITAGRKGLSDATARARPCARRAARRFCLYKALVHGFKGRCRPRPALVTGKIMAYARIIAAIAALSCLGARPPWRRSMTRRSTASARTTSGASAAARP